MTKGKKFPSSKEGWLEYLLPRNIPSVVNVAKPCLKAMKEDDLSYPKIAERLINDPVIALLIMREANADRNKPDVFSKTLDNAMSMIGMQRLEAILINTPLLPEDYGYRAFYRAHDRSLTKAFLAKEFARKKLPAKKDEVFWGSLFSDAALWYLWCFATPVMREYEAAEATKKHALSEQLFGCELRELQISLLEALGAPELAIKANTMQDCLSAEDWVMLSKFALSNEPYKLEHDNDSELEELPARLKIARQSPLFMIELASLYVHYLREAKSAKQASRAISIASAGLDMSPKEFHGLTTQAFLSYSRKIRFPFCAPPATLLFMDYDVPHRTEEEFTKPSSERAPERALSGDLSTTTDAPKKREEGGIEVSTAATARRVAAKEPPVAAHAAQENFKPSAAFLQLLKRIKTEPDSFASAHELMQETIATLVDGLSLKRGVIALINQERRALKVYYQHGMDASDPLAKFASPMVSSTVFKILADKPAALWVKPSDKKSVTDLVPLNFKQTTQADEGLFMSVFVKQRPVAIIYADKHPEQGIMEAQFKYFKLMNKALESALTTLGSAKK